VSDERYRGETDNQLFTDIAFATPLKNFRALAKTLLSLDAKMRYVVVDLIYVVYDGRVIGHSCVDIVRSRSLPHHYYIRVPSVRVCGLYMME